MAITAESGSWAQALGTQALEAALLLPVSDSNLPYCLRQQGGQKRAHSRTLFSTQQSTSQGKAVQ